MDYVSAAGRILKRLKKDRYRSYDHYDFWGSKTGTTLRKYKNVFTLPVIGAAYFADVVFPMFLRTNVEPAVSMETLPYIMRSMLAYKRLAGKDDYEKERAELMDYMAGRLGKSEHGRGVGHQFDWYTDVHIPAYTPCVTFTSYLVDYMLESHEEGEIPEKELALLKDIGEFVFNDLNRVDINGDAAKVSYTPLDGRYVINANSYAARMMLRLGKLLGREDYLDLAGRLLGYVLSEQNRDGSWFYFEKGSVSEKENFIDCFHSAFVIENLIEWAFDEESERAEQALERAVAYFVEAFVNEDGGVNHFSKSHLPVKIIADIRSSAEAINCLALLSSIYPEYLKTAERVYGSVMGKMYDGNGGFYFRRYSFYLSKMNYIRWGAAPMLNAVTNLALAKGRGPSAKP